MLKLKRKSVRLIIMLILSGSFLFASDILKESQIGFRLHYLYYSSYSEQRSSLPLIAGYPAVKAAALDFGLDLRYKQHEMVFEYAAPVDMNSLEGISLSYTTPSRYSRFSLDYAYHFDLFKWGKLKGQHGINTGLLYENRLMVYLSNSYELTRDVNLYMGPRVRLVYDFSDFWALRFNFDGRFYLPYLNFGIIEAVNESGATVYESNYYAFYYQTVFELALTRTLPRGNSFQIGIKKNDLLGFANSRRLFRIDDLIHYKFDRLYHCFISINFNLWEIIHNEN